MVKATKTQRYDWEKVLTATLDTHDNERSIDELRGRAGRRLQVDAMREAIVQLLKDPDVGAEVRATCLVAGALLLLSDRFEEFIA